MFVRVLKSTVVEGSVRWEGEVIDLPNPLPEHYPGNLVDQLEADGVVERVNEEDYTDTMLARFGSLPAQPSVRDVMVFTPVYRLESETVESVLNLSWDWAITWVLQRDNPVRIVGDLNKSGEARRQGISNNLHQMQRARETFLQGRYDAMLVVESDIIPPRDALVRLAAMIEQGIDVAYGVYRFRTSDVINIFELYPVNNGLGPGNPGESLSIHPHLLRRALRLGVYPCSGAGFGCTLIRRRVLEAVEFRVDERESAHADSYWIRDVLKAGFRSAAEMRVVCGHKDEEGRVLWPKLGEELGIANEGLGSGRVEKAVGKRERG